jgi:hypothetical protein
MSDVKVAKNKMKPTDASVDNYIASSRRRRSGTALGGSQPFVQAMPVIAC